MKMPKSVIASLGVLVLGASALVQAAPYDQGALTVAARKASTNNVAMTIAARRTTVAAAHPRTSVRFGRSSMTTTASSPAAHHHRQMCAWCAASHCPVATTANASITAPWRACRYTRAMNGAVTGRMWC